MNPIWQNIGRPWTDVKKKQGELTPPRPGYVFHSIVTTGDRSADGAVVIWVPEVIYASAEGAIRGVVKVDVSERETRPEIEPSQTGLSGAGDLPGQQPSMVTQNNTRTPSDD